MKAAIAIVISLVVAGVFLFFCVATVPTGRVGVVNQFGKITGDVLGEGIHFINPVNSVIPLDLRMINSTEKTECFSKDLQHVTIYYSLLTRLPKDNAISVLQNIGPHYVETVIVPKVQEVLKQHTAQYDAEDLVAKRDEIRAATIATLVPRVKGVADIQDIVIRNIDFSNEYERAIEEKQVAMQKALKATYELQQAKVEADKRIVEAEGEAKAITLQGEALVKNPAMVRYEAMKKWDGKVPATVLLTDQLNSPIVLPAK